MFPELPNWTLDEFFTIGEGSNVIGKGAFGQVVKVIHKPTAAFYAMKMIKKEVIREKGMEEQVIKEVGVHLQLRHTNVIALYHYFEDKDRIYLILELADKGHLYGYMKSFPCNRIPPSEAKNFFYQVCSGLRFLHDNFKVIHRDIKPENILLSSGRSNIDTTISELTAAASRAGALLGGSTSGGPLLSGGVSSNLIVKIADFGWTAQILSESDEKVEEEGGRQTFCGTPDYLSPEMLELLRKPEAAPNIGHGVDLWAVGVLLFELLSGESPFKDKHLRTQMNKIEEVQYILPEQILALDRKDLTRDSNTSGANQKLSQKDDGTKEEEPSSGVSPAPGKNTAESPSVSKSLKKKGSRISRAFGSDPRNQHIVDPDSAAEIIVGLLKKDPKQRMPILKVLNHKWLESERPFGAEIVEDRLQDENQTGIIDENEGTADGRPAHPLPSPAVRDLPGIFLPQSIPRLEPFSPPHISPLRAFGGLKHPSGENKGCTMGENGEPNDKNHFIPSPMEEYVKDNIPSSVQNFIPSAMNLAFSPVDTNSSLKLPQQSSGTLSDLKAFLASLNESGTPVTAGKTPTIMENEAYSPMGPVVPFSPLGPIGDLDNDRLGIVSGMGARADNNLVSPAKIEQQSSMGQKTGTEQQCSMQQQQQPSESSQMSAARQMSNAVQGRGLSMGSSVATHVMYPEAENSPANQVSLSQTVLIHSPNSPAIHQTNAPSITKSPTTNPRKEENASTNPLKEKKFLNKPNDVQNVSERPYKNNQSSTPRKVLAIGTSDVNVPPTSGSSVYVPPASSSSSVKVPPASSPQVSSPDLMKMIPATNKFAFIEDSMRPEDLAKLMYQMPNGADKVTSITDPLGNSIANTISDPLGNTGRSIAENPSLANTFSGNTMLANPSLTNSNNMGIIGEEVTPGGAAQTGFDSAVSPNANQLNDPSDPNVTDSPAGIDQTNSLTVTNNSMESTQSALLNRLATIKGKVIRDRADTADSSDEEHMNCNNSSSPEKENFSPNPMKIPSGVAISTVESTDPATPRPLKLNFGPSKTQVKHDGDKSDVNENDIDEEGFLSMVPDARIPQSRLDLTIQGSYSSSNTSFLNVKNLYDMPPSPYQTTATRPHQEIPQAETEVRTEVRTVPRGKRKL